MELFGPDQLEHDERYAYGQEWLGFRDGAVELRGLVQPRRKCVPSKGAHAYPKPIMTCGADLIRPDADTIKRHRHAELASIRSNLGVFF